MIKEVNEIPKPNCKPSSEYPVGYYRELIRQDIKSAYEQKIAMCELVGYDTKPDYLAQAARDESYNVCKELVYDPAKKYVVKKLSKEFLESIRCTTPKRYSPNHIIKIRGITLKDGIKHVYCEIDFKAAKEFKKELLKDSRDKTNAALRRERKKHPNDRYLG